METTKIILENGQTIKAGPDTPALASVQLTQAVNGETELTVGSVCAAMAQIHLIVDGPCPIAHGDTFSLWRDHKKVGVFTAEKPKWTSAHGVQITAYDAVIALEKDLGGWLQALEVWPATLRELAQAVCDHCGVALAEDAFPNQDYPAKPFKGSNITGRKILSWIAQAAGRFCVADEDGVLRFGWYRPVEAITIGPKAENTVTASLEGETLTLQGVTATLTEENLQIEGVRSFELDAAGNLTLLGDRQYHYYQGSLELADYETAPVEKVQIRQDEEDIGVIYPDIGQANTYIITGNPLLATDTPEELLPIAQSLYELLQTVRYTPCTVTVDAGTGLGAGDIVTVTDLSGRRAVVYLMESSRTATKEVFKCTGSATRDSVSVTHDSSWQALSGKVLRLQADVEGLRAEHADAAGNSAALSVTIDGIESKVTSQVADMDSMKEQLSTLRQEKDSLQLQLQTIQQEGVTQVVTTTGYRFSDEGLQISKSGMEMENRLDHSGMLVSRSGEQILRADNQGVAARDVTVGNFLIVGSSARFEDYNGGTACFYVG